MKPKLSLIAEPQPFNEEFALPEVIDYYDDFADAYRQLVNPAGLDVWCLSLDGRAASLNFDKFPCSVRRLIKAWFADVLHCLSPRTTEYYFCGASKVPAEKLLALTRTTPVTIRTVWNALHSSELSYYSLAALKSLLSFMVHTSVGAWTPVWADFVSKLPLPKVDKYAGVRTGEVFLEIEQEAAIVEHIDKVCQGVKQSPDAIEDLVLEKTSILACSYQFGLRSKQIAKLEMRDIQIWSVDGTSTVHLTFVMIKQRSARRVFPMVRRVKTDWAPLFIELHRRAKTLGLSGSDHVFCRTPADVQAVIAGMTEKIVGQRRYSTELRHTAAQRMVDAGASEEEVAEFLGHSDLDTGLIYFRSSPAQAERVNQALGVSETYKQVATIARSGFISPEHLAALKGDQQIAGVPHGIPIAGIGGCTVGQPNCSHNPVLSCYGCRKFMPVSDIAIHNEVLVQLRKIFKLYYSASRGQSGSPALQLEHTISEVQSIIRELGGQRRELQS